MTELNSDKDDMDGDPAGLSWYEALPFLICAAITKDSYLRSICHKVASLSTCSNCCNNIGEFNLNEFQLVQSILIGDNSFRSIETFCIDGLPRLYRLEIGNDSFTSVTPKHWRVPFTNEALLQRLNKTNKSFHILNCEKLKSIKIGVFSFSDFAGQFELKNLPSLECIKIGTIDDVNNLSSNFHFSSFHLTGNDCYWFITLLDLPALKTLYLGGGVFQRSLFTKLESIRIFEITIV